jgi:CheY-like chemotaxis protein
VTGDGRELQELLLSLVLDPGDADAPPRRVALAATSVHLEEDEARALKVDPRCYVEVSVGCRPPVFALTAAFRLARRHGGALVLDDDEVRLLLPAQGAPGGPAPAGDPDGRRLVLVVDDTEALRHLTARALEKHGYAVLEAGSGAEALTLLDGNDVDLVLTDVVMPRMSGLELHHAITAGKDAPTVVFMSGYSDTVLPEGEAVGPVLRKPFSEQELLDHVRGGLTPLRKARS